MATAAKEKTHSAPTPLPATAPNQPDKYADAASSGLKIGEKALLTAVHGRIVHPTEVPLEFNTGVATKAIVDRWIIIQFEAGKIKLASDD